MDIKEVVKSKLCIGCGLCTVDSSIKGMHYSPQNGCFTPVNTKLNKKSLSNEICPGKGYNIIQMSAELFNKNKSTQYDLSLGYFDFYAAGRSLSDKVLDNASSGGMITEILLYLLDNNIVDKVSVTTFEYGSKGVTTKTTLTSDKNEILKAQGSKYCPVNLMDLIKELTIFTGKVAIVAVPCSIAALREIIKKEPSKFSAKVDFLISNFCGGHKSMINIKRLAKLHNVNYQNLSYFRFRGGGQPGSLKFIESGGKTSSTNYPKYVGMTGESKMLRCHLCVDATGELADISCGDAWLPRFINSGYPWSIVLCRNEKSTKIIKAMESGSKVELEQLTIEEIKKSQKENLTSKKLRQQTRMVLYKSLGYKIPKFDGGYSTNRTSLKIELRVFLKHKFKYSLQKIGLYPFIRNTKEKKK